MQSDAANSAHLIHFRLTFIVVTRYTSLSHLFSPTHLTMQKSHVGTSNFQLIRTRWDMMKTLRVMPAWKIEEVTTSKS